MGLQMRFNLNNLWFDSDCLAIDQGPEIVMIENYRSGLLWNLFMSCPEVKTGMKNLAFHQPEPVEPAKERNGINFRFPG